MLTELGKGRWRDATAQAVRTCGGDGAELAVRVRCGSAVADFAGERGSKGARGYGPQNLTPKGPGRVAGAHRGLD